MSRTTWRMPWAPRRCPWWAGRFVLAAGLPRDGGCADPAAATSVATISRGIIAPEERRPAPTFFINAMMAALILFAACRINSADPGSGAPVSTAHSVVGGVWARIAAVGLLAVQLVPHERDRPRAGSSRRCLGGHDSRPCSWPSSRNRHPYQDDKTGPRAALGAGADGIMGGAFAAYLAMKGASRAWSR